MQIAPNERTDEQTTELDDLRKERDNIDQKEEDAELYDAYLNWLDDTSYLEDYDQYEFFGQDVLIRVFRFEPTTGVGSGFLADFEGNSLLTAFSRNIPVARVIKAGDDCTKNLKAGDIVSIPDKIGMTIRNPAWDMWMEEASNSRPKVKGSEPPKYLDGLIKWSEKVFLADKLKGVQKKDTITFLVPHTYLRSKISVEDEKMRVASVKSRECESLI